MPEAEPFYDQFTHKEWDRLEHHRTELAVTLRAMEDFLPPPPCKVLDIGGGPGRYSIELSNRGYKVTLYELAQKNLDLAQQKASKKGVLLEGLIKGDARDLSSLGDQTFEAVLLMGPLYHLLEESDRATAVRQAIDHLTPQGVLLASFITRFAPIRQAAIEEPQYIVENKEYTRRLLDTGVHDQAEKFAFAYFAHPEEIEPFMHGCGLKTMCVLGVEGVLAGHEETVNSLEGDAWQAWVELNYRLGQEPFLYGASDHMVYIGKKV
jgi:2-polyprenyl-3-methyl-5-hydroxy-6-metoxy-1,4-benzoquinol methylase